MMKGGKYRRSLCLVALLLVSCSIVVRPGKKLDEVCRDYAQRLRWMDFVAASHYLDEPHREGFLRQFQALEGLHMVDVRIESIDYRPEENRAETSLVIEYYLLPSATVKTYRLRQQWRYEGGDRYHFGTWQITSPFPDFP